MSAEHPWERSLGEAHWRALPDQGEFPPGGTRPSGMGTSPVIDPHARGTPVPDKDAGDSNGLPGRTDDEGVWATLSGCRDMGVRSGLGYQLSAISYQSR